MAIYLDERRFGCDDQIIGFPHLLVCMGFVAFIERQGNKYMCGYHLTSGTENCKREFSIFAQEILNHVQPNEIKKIYGSCNFNEHYKNSVNKVTAWRDEMTYFAGQLNFNGKAYGFDTSIIGPRDGTYIQYQMDPLTDRCRIFYRQNDRMVFDHDQSNAPDGGLAVFSVDRGLIPDTAPQKLKDHYLRLATDHTETQKLSTVGILKIKKGKGLFAKGILREVDYGLRLIETNIN
jgi:hypothetical protein